MRGRIFLLPVAITIAGASRLPAQTLGDVGAAGAISSSMDAGGSAGTLAVGSRAARDARRLGANPYIGGSNAGNAGYMDEVNGSERGGSSSGYGGSRGGPPPGAIGAGSGPPTRYSGPPGAPGSSGEVGSGGGPEFPSPDGQGGAAAAPVYPKKEPLHWGKESGGGFIDELRSHGTRARGSGRNPRGSGSRAGRLSQKQLARLPQKTRSQIIASKYKKPPVGYLSYYLPEDRYKLTSGLWKFVTVEDDRAIYPVKHYFRPDSPRFLSIVAQKPRGSQARHNRVLGFSSWQEALIAGYRPDPISKPAPGLELATIAGMAPREEASHYAEFLYAGQIPPEEFRRTYAYMLKVRGVINSRADTRKYLRPTMGQILLAALGEGPVPTSVGGPPRAIVTANVAPGGYGSGSSGGYGSGSSGGYSNGRSGYPNSGSSGSTQYP